MKLNNLNKAKFTENGDLAFTSPSNNPLLNIFFLAEYYQHHLSEVPDLDLTERSRLFAMFMRDPRYGMGYRDLGRTLLNKTYATIDQVIKCGRVDDLFQMSFHPYYKPTLEDYLYKECIRGNALVKKWMPRFGSKHDCLAKHFADAFFTGKPGCETKLQRKVAYGHLIKCDTIEQYLSRKETEKIVFEHVPSLAMLKYAKRFSTKPDTAERYAKYLQDVRSGKKNLNISVTTCYDIYRNREQIDADLFFDKLPKVYGSWVPIIDTSGSMYRESAHEAGDKALAIGHYLAKTSTIHPNKAITFSSNPVLLELGVENEYKYSNYFSDKYEIRKQNLYDLKGYQREIASLITGDCSNTNFGRVMQLLSFVEDLPEYLVVLSDMEFDQGSNMSKDVTMNLWKRMGYKTKIVWWNLNSCHTTAPELDENGNIFMSGYNPTLLKFMEAGFDGEKFLDKLLSEYEKLIKD